MNKARQKGNKREFAGFPAVIATPGATTSNATASTASSATANKDKDKGKEIGGVQITGDTSEKHGRGHGGKRDSGHGRGLKPRGRFDVMQYIHGFIACLLVLLALIHIPFPEPLAWLPYSIAAALALITLKSEISLPVSRVLAIATTGMMFFFFALFFLVVPTLKEGWYTTQYGWAAVCLLLSAFVMIPILSDYSCRLKADCREARAARRSAFFSVPSHINPESR